MNCGQRFVTLYRRQGSRPSTRKRNAKKQKNAYTLRETHKHCETHTMRHTHRGRDIMGDT